MNDPGLLDEPSLIPEAEETVRAIQRGTVDAVVVQAHGRFQVVTLTGADEPYRVLVDRMSEGALTVSEDGVVMFVNRRLAEMTGRNVHEIVGQPIADLFAGDVPSSYRAWVRPPEEGLLHEVDLARPGEPLRVSVWAGPMTIGDVPAALVTVTDLTVQRRAEEIAIAERFARSILEQVTDPIIVLDTGGRVIRASAAAEELCEIPPFGRRFSDVFQLQPADPNHLPLLPSVSPSEFDMMLATRAFHGVEVQLRDSKAAGRTFLLSAGPLLDENKCSVGSIVTLTDITSRKRAEELQSLMVAELNHRVKNTLAVVQAIANQTARRSSSLAIFREAFGGRLRALSIAHNMLTETRWSGVELTVLLRESLAPYRDRLRFEGPPISLPSQTIVPMSLIVHELMTNAAKYGALSTSGHVAINWETDDQMVLFTWVERGGPPVKDKKKAGFGSTLIERVAIHDLGGKCTLDFQSEGLRYSLRFPIQPERNTVGASPTSRASLDEG
jgi:PAS domain S-box-containing protein